MNISEGNLTALLSLLEDPDDATFMSIMEWLAKKDIEETIALLDKLWRQADSELVISRLDWLIPQARLVKLTMELYKWMNTDDREIIKGAWLVATYQYPELTFEEIDDAVTCIVKDVWMELNDGMTAEEEIDALNRVFYGKYGMTADTKNRMSINNGFINNVLNTRLASHLVMTILYLGVAQRASIPVQAVWLHHALRLAYVMDNNIDFYIEVFFEGKIFDHEIAKYIVTQQGVPFTKEYVRHCENDAIILGLLHELCMMYDNKNMRNSAEDMNKLLSKLRVKNK
jgi:hypothetical protein